MRKSTNTLIIVPYDPEWINEFERLKAMLTEQIGDLILNIDHIGSTSVEGLAAKPIIDLDVVIDSYNVFPEIVSRLGKIGFIHEGDLGVKDREAFKRTIPDDFMDYHLYICPKYSEAHIAHAKFRDYLRTHPDAAKAYALQKMWLIEQCGGSRKIYTSSKYDFVKGILNDTDGSEVFISGNRLNIRRACISDSEFISNTEADPDNSPWVANWPLRWRISKFGDEDFLQTILETKNGCPIGFIIFRDMLQKEKQVQLKRIALINEYKNQGYGKESLLLAQKLAFEVFCTDKLYLSTKTENIRAQNIYKATGFIPEGPDPCVNFHIMKSDYEQKVKRPQ